MYLSLKKCNTICKKKGNKNYKKKKRERKNSNKLVNTIRDIVKELKVGLSRARKFLPN